MKVKTGIVKSAKKASSTVQHHLRKSFQWYLVFLPLFLDFQAEGTNNSVNKPFSTLIW